MRWPFREYELTSLLPLNYLNKIVYDTDDKDVSTGDVSGNDVVVIVSPILYDVISYSWIYFMFLKFQSLLQKVFPTSPVVIFVSC